MSIIKELFFSASKNTFIPKDWKFDGTYTVETWPSDAVELSEDEVSTYSTTPPAGKALGSEGGRPAWVDPPPLNLTPEEAEWLASSKVLNAAQLAANQKSALTNRIGVINDSVRFDMATAEEIAELPLREEQRDAWGRYAVYLGRVTSQPGWPETIEWPQQPAEGIDLAVSPVGES